VQFDLYRYREMEDLAELFEQSAANGTPIREIVGADPVEFAEAFQRDYPEGQWTSRVCTALAWCCGQRSCWPALLIWATSKQVAAKLRHQTHEPPNLSGIHAFEIAQLRVDS
jgi:hypothetical protein